MSDWQAALSFALGMGIQPDQFWRLSVAEWRMLTRGAAALGRDELRALMARFPDGEVPSRGHRSDGADPMSRGCALA